VESFLARHGGKTIVLGRFVGLVRALAPFVAGSSKMSARRFVPASFVATGLWSSSFCLLGYVFWQSFDRALEVAQEGSLAFVAVLAAVTTVVVLYRRRNDRTPAGSRPR
jgi:undecaprenyl-diphosphatase